ncbi:hypothetical protein ACQVP2_24225 [Methylobacterium aquaticum]
MSEDMVRIAYKSKAAHPAEVIPTVVDNDLWCRSRIFAKPKVPDIWA